MTDQPLTAPCDHCHQTRVLWLYDPDHNAHFGGGMATCRWCTRDKQPLLCTRCWSNERLLEEADPVLNAEADELEQICAKNTRLAARQARDRAECDGIAAATTGRRDNPTPGSTGDVP